MSLSSQKTPEVEQSSLFANAWDDAAHDSLFNENSDLAPEASQLNEAALQSLQHPVDENTEDLDSWLAGLQDTDVVSESSAQAEAILTLGEERRSSVDLGALLCSSPTVLVPETPLFPVDGFSQNNSTTLPVPPTRVLELPNFGPFADADDVELANPISPTLETDLNTLMDTAVVGLPGAAADCYGEYDMSAFPGDGLTTNYQLDLQNSLLNQDASALFHNLDANQYSFNQHSLCESNPLPQYGFDHDLTAAGFQSSLFMPMPVTTSEHYSYNAPQELPVAASPLGILSNQIDNGIPPTYMDTDTNTSAVTSQRYGGDSETTSDDESRHSRPKLYNFDIQKPKHDPHHAWVKYNPNAKGSTRTGKINQYKSAYFYGEPRSSPVGAWISGKYRFEYNRYGELEDPTYSTKQIRAFIENHPGKLTMYIQKCPSDSARRYPTGSLALCRFAQCPSRLMGYHGKIQPGHYRVSFDEKFAVHGNASDPYFVAFNAHLYCVERLLNFPDLCARFQVKVETRNYSGTEPRSKFSGEIAGRDGDVAQKFIDRCKNGGFDRKYPSYPRRADWEADPYNAHMHTLNRQIQEAGHSSKSANRQEFLREQGNKGSNIIVHMGDIQMQLQSKVNARAEARGLKRQEREEKLAAKRNLVDSSSDDDDEYDDYDSYYRRGTKRQRR